MESKKVFTRAMLQEECGITNVTETYFTKEVHKVRANKDVKMTTYPTLSLQKTKDKKRVHYISLTTSLYNYKTKKYISLPFHKMRYIWEYGSCPMGVTIDHIDTNPLNNDLSNLRMITESENQDNRKRWKQFTLEEVEGKTINQLKEMIAQRIEEYKDVPYSEIKAQERSEQKAREREEWLLHTDERLQERKRKTRITTLKRQISKKEYEIFALEEGYTTHSDDYIAKKTTKLKLEVRDLKNELSKLV